MRFGYHAACYQIGQYFFNVRSKSISNNTTSIVILAFLVGISWGQYDLDCSILHRPKGF